MSLCLSLCLSLLCLSVSLSLLSLSLSVLSLSLSLRSSRKPHLRTQRFLRLGHVGALPLQLVALVAQHRRGLAQLACARLELRARAQTCGGQMGQMGRWADGADVISQMGRWADGQMGRWGRCQMSEGPQIVMTMWRTKIAEFPKPKPACSAWRGMT